MHCQHQHAITIKGRPLLPSARADVGALTVDTIISLRTASDRQGQIMQPVFTCTQCILLSNLPQSQLQAMKAFGENKERKKKEKINSTFSLKKKSMTFASLPFRLLLFPCFPFLPQHSSAKSFFWTPCGWVLQQHETCEPAWRFLWRWMGNEVFMMLKTWGWPLNPGRDVTDSTAKHGARDVTALLW